MPQIYCSECDHGIALPDKRVAADVAKMCCPGCGARFQVLAGGATVTLSGENLTGEAGESFSSHWPTGSSGQAGRSVGESVFDLTGYVGSSAGIPPKGYDSSGVRSSGGAGISYPVLQPGEIFRGKWRIEEELGRGATAVVYRATDLDAELEVALKVVGVVGVGADALRKNWAEEYKARQQVEDGRHLLRVESPVVEERSGVAYVALPQELGVKTFGRWLAETRDDLEGRREEGLRLFSEACRGVAALHEKGIAHLDLKPENIVLVEVEEGRKQRLVAKVGDFGLARAAGSLRRREGFGTPKYMAPEQIRSAREKEIGPWSDVYVLGCILFELLDGEAPFSGTPDELKQKHLELNPPVLLYSPERLGGLVQQALRKNRGARNISVAEFIGETTSSIASSSGVGQSLQENDNEITTRHLEEVVPKKRKWIVLHEETLSFLNELIQQKPFFVESYWSGAVREQPLSHDEFSLLCRCGAIYDYSNLEEKVVVIVDILALAVFGYGDRVLSFVKETENILADSPAFLYVLKNADTSKAYLLLDKESPRKGFVEIVAGCFLKDFSLTEKYLKLIEDSIKGGGVEEFTWHYLAKVYHFILQDRENTERCLKAGNEKLTSPFALQRHADSWLSINNSTKGAKTCLRKGEAEADVSEFLEFADFSLSRLCDQSEIIRYLEMAESMSQAEEDFSARELVDLAGKWLKIFEDESRCRATLEAGLKRCDDPRELIVVGSGFIRFLQEPGRFYEILARVEQQELDFENAYDVASELFDLSNRNFRGKIIKFLSIAESKIDSFSDLESVIEFWMENFEDRAEVARLLRVFENQSSFETYVDDQVSVAKVWINYLGEKEEAIRLFEQMLIQVDNLEGRCASELISIANLGVLVNGSDHGSNLDLLYENALEISNSDTDFVSLIKSCDSYSNKKFNKSHIYAMAFEKMAYVEGEILEFVILAVKDLEDGKKRAFNLLKRLAEDKNNGAFEYINIIEACFEINEKTMARELLKKAEKTSDIVDWRDEVDDFWGRV
ncbi:MAG: serine/threonine protein kinase [Opitutales bacterium]